MKLTIIYDNQAFSRCTKDIEVSWGFSCIIESDGKQILFDTGWRGNILLDNMNKLGFDLKDIKIVVLSHLDWDHIGGLPCVLNQGKDFEIYLPKSFSEKMKNEIEKKYPIIEISEPQKITDRIYSLGELGKSIKEQSIAIKTKNGLLIVTGCAHPKLDVIIKKASEIDDVYGIIGGFHGFKEFDVLKDLELIVPCHCTRYKKELKHRFPDKVEFGGVGYSLKI